MTKSRKITGWLAFISCFIGIPGFLLLFGMLYLQNQDTENRLESQHQKLRDFYLELRKFADPQYYWCTALMEKLAPDSVASEASAIKEPGAVAEVVIARLKDLRRNLKFNYVVYTPTRGVLASSFPLEPLEVWKPGLSFTWKVIQSGRSQVSHEEQVAGGKIFGPQLYWGHFDSNISIGSLYLIWGDSSFKRPLAWGRIIHRHLVLAFIDIKDLKGNDGILNLLNEFSQNSGHLWRFSLQDDAHGFRHGTGERKVARQVEAAADEYGKHKTQKIETEDLMVYPFFLRPGIKVYGFIEKSRFSSSLVPGYAWSVVFLFFAVAYLLAGYAWGLFFGDRPDDLSLRWKLRFLFFFANGLPLLVLFFIGNDYLAQKRSNLMLDAHSRGIGFIQDFDEKIEVEYARRLVGKKKAQEKMIEKLTLNMNDDQALQEFVDTLGSDGTERWKIVMVASRSNTIVTEKGVYDESRNLSPKEDEQRAERSRNQNELTRKIGQFFLDKINGVEVSEKVQTELELFIESTTQQPLANFLFDLLQKRGSFIQWGFGQNVNPAIFDTFSLKNSSSQDLFFLSSFGVHLFQYNYLLKAVPQANRNNIGLKLVALMNQEYTVPREAYNSAALREFANSLTSYPGKEIKIVDYLGEKHLAMGIAGRHIKDFRLIGLYPLEKIDNLIDSQRRQLLLFALLSLFMTWGLSQVLAQSFILPLQQITAGAHAIENKHFSHRLPDLGRDEFGAMGRVFNSVMVDLEELSVASAIQEQLLPQQQIETGNFSLFGKSVSMGELGGDYFDHIELADGKFSVLLGDVAGHGVGAALIMAMAKAGIIQSEHLLDQPLALVARLHGLIFASKTKKQKKVMTFQYLCLDGTAGRGIYSNAGACSPMIVRKNAGQVEELTLTGAALGAFKKANYSETEVVFNPGDAIVFYTDGIVEARNRNGEELGYDRLKQLLLETWNIDAEVFYHNVFNAYLRHIGDEGAQDDLTMVILVFDPQRTRGSTPPAAASPSSPEEAGNG